ncbi:MAG: hypothetical protein HY764_03885 [Candidatus Portnoybacteria bacterium]|nr:hypothetical protein [Candidatus Portnoybacteria bacterium]
MFLTALILFNFLITVFVVFSLAILFHFRKYRWPGDLNTLSAAIYIVGAIFFVSLAFYFFIACPWDMLP